ncbi:MAG: response regulator transcription factor [Thermomicrobiales bacterium]|nr:response regulator transcription factor [Thermomicrobiales bacterium]MCO5225538.1 response regulator transcription factor [Thermomicrobiales bacterium]
MTDTNSPLILVVDDEPNIRDAIAFTLKREGFRVVTAATGVDALEQAKSNPDVILLDIMLPGMDGLEVLRRIRSSSNVPVLMLSAKGEEIDRVVGLEIGADDYITKPFAMRELVARIRAIVRRVGMQTHVSRDLGWKQMGRLSLNPTNRQVKVDDELVELKPKEFDLLMYFTRHPGVVLSRDALLREVWGYDFQIDTRTVDVHIRWLRTKLERNPASPQMFLTVRGSGYRFVPDSQ